LPPSPGNVDSFALCSRLIIWSPSAHPQA
jgi:hypothetical protein